MVEPEEPSVDKTPVTNHMTEHEVTVEPVKDPKVMKNPTVEPKNKPRKNEKDNGKGKMPNVIY